MFGSPAFPLALTSHVGFKKVLNNAVPQRGHYHLKRSCHCATHPLCAENEIV